MTVLVLGNGAREHALCWKLAREGGVSRLLCAPGNGGTTAFAEPMMIDPAAPEAVRDLVEREHVDFTLVGPELPLTRGVVDVLTACGHAVSGPTREAAELESSKAFAKAFMVRHRVPTARHIVCACAQEAFDVIRAGSFGLPVVLKADGLAAGKGVVVATDRAAAEVAIGEMMLDRRYGDAGACLVIEECLQGREVSFFVLTDGERAVVLPSAEDHKRALDGDRGPNTGGMGAFSPSPVIDGPMSGRIMDEIVEPTLAGMRAEGRTYRGFLYVGLMLTATGPHVIEFNARLGDPETQVTLPRIDEELLPLLQAAARGALGATCVRTTPDPCVGVVLASAGYPGPVETGHVITGLVAETGSADGPMVFHAGTARRGDEIVTAGGRVLTVVARGADMAWARDRAYEAVTHIAFNGVQYRRDIGLKAIEA